MQSSSAKLPPSAGATVVTRNMAEAIGIGQWTREVRQAGLIDQEEIVVYADEHLREWCIEHPGYACESAATAFWPEDETAHHLEVEHRTLRSFPRGAETALGEFLVEHDIELAGLPEHRGRREDAGGFVTALAAAVEAERARTRTG